MRNYLESKVVEYSIIISYIDQELQRLSTEAIHAQIVGSLESTLEDMKERNERILSLLQIPNDMLIPIATRAMHQLESEINIISFFYLPGLQKEGLTEQTLQKLFISKSTNHGQKWIRDALVRLDSNYAIWPSPEIPVIFAPPQQAMTLLNMPCMFHELGHNFVRRYYRDIIDSLADKSIAYFSELRKSSGPMSPEKLSRRNLRIEQIEDYWVNEKRLNEFFSDVYAAYVCGPAYYFSCVNLAMSLGGNPYVVELCDAHPPGAFRVLACERTLNMANQGDTTAEMIAGIWRDYYRNWRKTPDHDFFCPSSLADSLVEESIRTMSKCCPDVIRYHGMTTVSSVEKELHSLSLEEILNMAIHEFLKTPKTYQEWERKTIAVLNEV
jgi:hypothetical protein